jgi:hypothetical protein
MFLFSSIVKVVVRIRWPCRLVGEHGEEPAEPDVTIPPSFFVSSFL